jgi:hypothetical protein
MFQQSIEFALGRYREAARKGERNALQTQFARPRWKTDQQPSRHAAQWIKAPLARLACGVVCPEAVPERCKAAVK